MLNFRLITASVLTIMAATSLSAATYTFDLQKVDSYQATKGDAGTLVDNTLAITETGTNGDLTGTFTGMYVEGASVAGGVLSGTSINEAHSVQRYNNGLGVCNIGACKTPGGDAFHTVDGAAINGTRTDFVEMAFFADGDVVDVTLNSLTFGWIGSIYNQYPGTTGAFEILISDLSDSMIGLGDILAYAGLAKINIAGDGGRGLFTLPDLAAFTDNIFGIKAGAGGSWKLMAATVDFDLPEVPEIPLPAAGWLLIGGLGGLVALRRRKST